MSGETIRDVVIRVSIQPGDTGGFKSAVEAAKSDIQAVAREMQVQAQKEFVAQQSGNASPSAAASAARGAPGYAESVIQQMRDQFAAVGRDLQAAGASPRAVDSATPQDAARNKLSLDGGAFQREIEAARTMLRERGAELEKAQESAARSANRMAAETMAAGAALAAFAFTAKIAFDTIERATMMASADRQIEIADVTSRSTMRSRNAQAETQAAVAREHAYVDYSQYRALAHLPEDRRGEASLRSMESRTDLTPQRKADIRRMSEADRKFEQRKQDIEARRQDIQNRQGQLNIAMSDANRRKKTAQESGIQRTGVIKAKYKEAQDYANSMLYAPGGKDRAREADALELQLWRARDESAKEEKQAEAEIASILEKQRDLAEQKLKLNEQALHVTREQKQAAYEDVREHREGMRQDATRIGSSSYGDQARLKLVDEKISRINAGSGEKLLPWEMQSAKSNNLGTTTVDQQAKERFESLGLKNLDRSQSQLEEKEERFKKLDAMPEEKSAEAAIQGGLEEISKAAENSLKSIEAILTVTGIVNELAANLQRVEAELKAREAQRGGIMTVWFDRG